MEIQFSMYNGHTCTWNHDKIAKGFWHKIKRKRVLHISYLKGGCPTVNCINK